MLGNHSFCINTHKNVQNINFLQTKQKKTGFNFYFDILNRQKHHCLNCVPSNTVDLNIERIFFYINSFRSLVARHSHKHTETYRIFLIEWLSIVPRRLAYIYIVVVVIAASHCVVSVPLFPV